LVRDAEFEGRRKNAPNRVKPKGTDEPFLLTVTARKENEFSGQIVVDAKRTYVIQGKITGDTATFKTELKDGFQQTYVGHCAGRGIEWTYEGIGTRDEPVRGVAFVTPKLR
jgi:hypothetical protein